MPESLSPPEIIRSQAKALAEFLLAIHAILVSRAEKVVACSSDDSASYRAEAKARYGRIKAHVPREYRESILNFLAAKPPRATGPRAFTHHDLGAEHILIGKNTFGITGVIDWSDAEIADPAEDFRKLYTDLGPEFVEQTLARYRAGKDPDFTDFTDRILFHARCSLLEDLEYGLASGHEKYARKSLKALQWTFGKA